MDKHKLLLTRLLSTLLPLLLLVSCLTADSYRKKGDKYYEAKDYSQALENYGKAEKKLGTNRDFLMKVARSYYNLNNLPACQQTLQKILELRPDDLEALRLQASMFSYTRNFGALYQTYQKILEVEPNDVIAYNNLGVMLTKTKKFHDARDMFLTAIRIKDDYADVYLNLANLYAQNFNDDETAYFFYKQFLNLKPTSSLAPSIKSWLQEYDLTNSGENTRARQLTHYFRGEKLLKAAEFDAARFEYETALKYHRDAETLYKYGYVLKELGIYDQSRKALVEALSLERDNTEFRYVLGWVYKLTGELDKAKAEWERILRSDPDHRRARKALTLIK